MVGERQRVEFFFAPGSRYSYLAASQVPALEAELGCLVDWRPVHGPDIRRRRGDGWRLCRAVYGSPASPLDEPLCLRVARDIGLDRDRYAALLADAETERLLDAAAKSPTAAARSVCRPSWWGTGCSGATTASCCCGTRSRGRDGGVRGSARPRCRRT